MDQEEGMAALPHPGHGGEVTQHLLAPRMGEGAAGGHGQGQGPVHPEGPPGAEAMRRGA